ncbi:deoxycytidylate deaminase [Pseudodesulfovibrio nedwellii]|uniref:Deoxycytidylate deaminase n=1 Tax=Pseudodesulfovibrio nedwellii TaxID=2973072 RepID=A0ABN6S6T8_9BACT|nr:anti-phage dCTP deaminase [Pseudodesulfovibrio nedwellii]BDQ37863.1 deoxycytidylate deaminase [Pseudodesulfovibrio nedwellii]
MDSAMKLGQTTKRKSQKPYDKIIDRETNELVIAFCGAAGSGTTKIAERLRKELEEREYTVRPIQLSALIKRHSKKGIDEKDHAKRIQMLQQEGTELRTQYGEDVLAMLSIKDIKYHREETHPSTGILQDPTERRYATIIDSLKHPHEERLLRKVYGDMFYLFGVLCPEDIRIQRLQHEKEMSPATAHTIVETDKSEEEKKGQQLLDTIHLSDFFFRNTDVDSKEIKASLVRFVDLILGANTITPTVEEYGMALAYSSSLRSGCISRQVGAAIVKDGDVIATGRNDVPRYDGGLYTATDSPDGRCFKWGTETCRNDVKKQVMKRKMLGLINDELPETSSLDEEKFNKICKAVGINNIIEYSRAIHAEMDALTTLARTGSSGAKGSTLLCTTYPCHNCARHIVAAGVRRVFYIEPYEKSLATELHNDSISTTDKPSEKPKKLEIVAFEGVGPTKYSRLFRQMDRKDKRTCGVEEINTRKSKPFLGHALDRFTDYEAKVVDYLSEIKLDQKRLPE